MDTVRDRLWLWCHAAGAHTRSQEQYGLAGTSRVAPHEAAHYMGLDNVLMVRHGDDLLPPTPETAATVADLRRVVWSIEGGGGADVDGVFALRDRLPDLTGVMMDDYFGRVQQPPRQWLAANTPTFPVYLTLRFREAVSPDAVELVQSQWRTGDYLSAGYEVEVSADGETWARAAAGSVPAAAGAPAEARLPGTPVRALRVAILGTRDTAGAFSCGLTRVRLRRAGEVLDLAGAEAAATSEYPGHPAANVLLPDDGPDEGPFSAAALRRLRDRLRAGPGRPLDIWVVLYTGEFAMSVLRPHLDLCDAVTMWTWRSADLAGLDASFRRFEELAAGKRKVLGLYMWDYGDRKPMPVEAMEHQCRTGLGWLRGGRIEGMIFLASCICDLGLEAVERSRRWIAEVGAEPLRAKGETP
jgi:hypothetical protein